MKTTLGIIAALPDRGSVSRSTPANQHAAAFSYAFPKRTRCGSQTRAPGMSRVLVIAILVLSQWLTARAATLEITIQPCFNQAPLIFDSLTNQTAAGQKISVTRLDFLVSGIALRRTGGSWVMPSKQFAYINGRKGETSFTLDDLPTGNFDRIRFQIGLPPNINHADAAQWPAGHPLNTELNHLYWSWSHEYIFLAFEGAWQNGAQQSGFSYHLATDNQLMMTALPIAVDTASVAQLRIALDVNKILSGVSQIQLSTTTDTTHSRANDSLAAQLRVNVQHAFAAGDVQTEPQMIASTERKGIQPASFLMAPNATPYRLTISKFFPQPDLPRDNPLTVEGVALGSRLFFDRRLSANNTESCANCHRPRIGFTDNRRFSRGIDRQIGTRNSMPLENLAWKKEFFWDGRAASLREQVLQPIQNPIEMHQSLGALMNKLSFDTNYHRLFANAFGSPEINSDRLARALEQFLLVQVSFNSKFDQVMLGTAKFTEDEQRGYQLFHTEYDPYHGQFGADCFHCHGGALFQSQDFANNGLDLQFRDLGRYVVTKRNGDQGKFSVPSLRNVAVTGPYMHDGRFRTLEEVVEHYSTGMIRSATLDPNLAKHPNGGVPLSASDKRALVAFLRTLTDDRFVQPPVVANTNP
jgi:cytochrome c peroxidase